MNIEACPEAIKELQHAFRYNDAILRNMILQQDEAVTEPSVILQPREERRERPSFHSQKEEA